MENSRVRFENRGLLILLGVLCVAIIGLGVGVALVFNQEQSASNDKSTTEYYEGESELDASIASGYYPGDEMSPEAYEHDYNYLTKMIETGLTNDGQEIDNSSRFFLKIALAKLMIKYGKLDESIEYLKTIEDGNLSNQEKASLYMAYVQAYMGLGDETNALLYTNLAEKAEHGNE